MKSLFIGLVTLFSLNASATNVVTVSFLSGDQLYKFAGSALLYAGSDSENKYGVTVTCISDADSNIWIGDQAANGDPKKGATLIKQNFSSKMLCMDYVNKMSAAFTNKNTVKLTVDIDQQKIIALEITSQ